MNHTFVQMKNKFSKNSAIIFFNVNFKAKSPFLRSVKTLTLSDFSFPVHIRSHSLFPRELRKRFSHKCSSWLAADHSIVFDLRDASAGESSSSMVSPLSPPRDPPRLLLISTSPPLLAPYRLTGKPRSLSSPYLLRTIWSAPICMLISWCKLSPLFSLKDLRCYFLINCGGQF